METLSTCVPKPKIWTWCWIIPFLYPLILLPSSVYLLKIWILHFSWESYPEKSRLDALWYQLGSHQKNRNYSRHFFFFLKFIFYFFFFSDSFFFFFVVNFVIHWNETSLSLHVFPIPIPPPTSLPTRFLQVLPEHQVRALVSCIQPGLVICFTLDSIHVSMLLSWNIPPSPSPTESKWLFYKSVSLFLFCI